ANTTVRDKASKFQFIPFIGKNKVDHESASKASDLLDQVILTIDDWKSQKSALSAALFKAAEVGSVEFVSMIINSLPLVVSWLNDDYQNIFHVAIIHRQEKIFQLIYKLGLVKNDLTGSADKSNNWMLHLAGKLAPPHRLDLVPGAALQLQSELKWFEAVKEIVPNISIDIKNLDNHTPYELFASTHTELMKGGEEWMKNTAASCSIVATLIATVVFAAVFTVPGGNDQVKGYPILLHHNSILLFTISDGAALFSSCTSVLMFLAILTSRFAPQDYLISLPRRLIIGLVLLFISMASMMFAFGVSIYILLQERYNWFYIPIIIAGGVPIILFLRMHYRLLIDLCQIYMRWSRKQLPILKDWVEIQVEWVISKDWIEIQ
ncbi:ankyrin repeat-containing protein ITN1-like, partial [Telopea speciosissima]|uniref:ankyrin repeat-containing protein ITN1-like n=1 Tax=Telopea speciosissima TaxID=54955 RepID=UPI001CC6BB1D